MRWSENTQSEIFVRQAKNFNLILFSQGSDIRCHLTWLKYWPYKVLISCWKISRLQSRLSWTADLKQSQRFKTFLRSARIDSKESITPAYVAWRTVRQPYSYPVPSPQRLFNNSSTVYGINRLLPKEIRSRQWLISEESRQNGLKTSFVPLLGFKTVGSERWELGIFLKLPAHWAMEWLAILRICWAKIKICLVANSYYKNYFCQMRIYISKSFLFSTILKILVLLWMGEWSRK